VIELVATRPDVDVPANEYIRLLGYPRGHVLQDRARDLADDARRWYQHHGRPWVYAREMCPLDVGTDAVAIEGVAFRSARLRKTLRDGDAHSVVLVAASAGPELEAEARARWQDGKPDEYFFLETYGSAVVDHLVTVTGARLCAWAAAERAAILPHDSPGYPGWDVAEQPRLMQLIGEVPRRHGTVELDVLDSGMLRPKKSQLAVFGVTRHTERTRRLAGLVPCERCAFVPCQFRRVPYRGSIPRGSGALAGRAAAYETATDIVDASALTERRTVSEATE
jgi:hypothetical protein